MTELTHDQKNMKKLLATIRKQTEFNAELLDMIKGLHERIQRLENGTIPNA